ncbi:hypothetical protein [Nocardia salmonicida]|uniref:hypothetical protein n=1 Tax=Nocardia salmonicida TaxID=53431 RepID=UPI00378F6AD2
MVGQPVRATWLASELGVSWDQMQGLMQDLGITALNGSSGISAHDASILRRWFENERRRMAEEHAADMRRENALIFDAFHDMQAPRQQQIGQRRPEFSCSCCGRNVGRPPSTLIELRADLYCPLCESHYELPGEPAARELERLRAHDADLRSYAHRAWLAQGGYRVKMKAAYRARDTWRTAFADVVLPHEPDGDGVCRSCRRPSPCSVWTTLKEANFGIFREMETLSTFDDDEREEILHPERVEDRDFEDVPR